MTTLLSALKDSTRELLMTLDKVEIPEETLKKIQSDKVIRAQNEWINVVEQLLKDKSITKKPDETPQVVGETARLRPF